MTQNSDSLLYTEEPASVIEQNNRYFGNHKEQVNKLCKQNSEFLRSKQLMSTVSTGFKCQTSEDFHVAYRPTSFKMLWSSIEILLTRYYKFEYLGYQNRLLS